MDASIDRLHAIRASTSRAPTCSLSRLRVLDRSAKVRRAR